MAMKRLKNKSSVTIYTVNALPLTDVNLAVVSLFQLTLFFGSTAREITGSGTKIGSWKRNTSLLYSLFPSFLFSLIPHLFQFIFFVSRLFHFLFYFCEKWDGAEAIPSREALIFWKSTTEKNESVTLQRDETETCMFCQRDHKKIQIYVELSQR